MICRVFVLGGVVEKEGWGLVVLLVVVLVVDYVGVGDDVLVVGVQGDVVEIVEDGFVFVVVGFVIDCFVIYWCYVGDFLVIDVDLGFVLVDVFGVGLYEDFVWFYVGLYVVLGVEVVVIVG